MCCAFHSLTSKANIKGWANQDFYDERLIQLLFTGGSRINIQIRFLVAALNKIHSCPATSDSPWEEYWYVHQISHQSIQRFQRYFSLEHSGGLKRSSIKMTSREVMYWKMILGSRWLGAFAFWCHLVTQVARYQFMFGYSLSKHDIADK